MGCAPCDRSGNCSQHGTERKRIGTTCVFNTFNLPSILVRYYGTFLGYKLGSQYIQKVYASGLMNILTKAASTVGLIMVGGMTAQMVTFTSKLEVSMKGESVMNLQNMLDQIFVGIVPLGITLLCYYLLKKKMSVSQY